MDPLQASYTYMDGDTTNLDTGVQGSITGLSKQSFDIVGLNVHGPVAGRLAFNWRDEFLDVRNIAAGYDLHVAVTKQLDGRISYRINDKFTVSLEGVNLLDTEFKDFFVDPNNTQLTGNFPRDTRRYDRAVIHDPTIIMDGGSAHVFSTSQMGQEPGLIHWRTSTDLLRWTRNGAVFTEMPRWVIEEVPGTRGIWTPDISYVNGEFRLYRLASRSGSRQCPEASRVFDKLGICTRVQAIVFARDRGFRPAADASARQ